MIVHDSATGCVVRPWKFEILNLPHQSLKSIERLAARSELRLRAVVVHYIEKFSVFTINRRWRGVVCSIVHAHSFIYPDH